MYKVLLVEDDPKICAIVSNHLQKWNIETTHIKDFQKVEEEFLNFNPHILVLDINLPFYDGFYWCNKIREHSNIPIVFLSSRTDKMDIMHALNMGGDDFIQKPFSLELMLTKLQALLRRTYTYQTALLQIIQHRDITLNVKTASITYNSQTIDLTKNEFKILSVLLERKKEIVSRETIMRAMWESETFVDDNTLTVNVNRLRRKLMDHGLEDYIVTKKGLGYILQ